ncbi:MAG: choice-of-anchor D domain-containing protein [Ignavibacteria bacterium]|nr:choice-of-anchor D domain-containing protein [Ignavibacteria bacterium]
MPVRSTLKQLYLFTISVITVVSASAQNPYDRLSIIEEFASATCTPCVAVNDFLKVVVDPTNGVVSVRYHVEGPVAGDPWNVQNPTDVNGRVVFYGIDRIPWLFLNGVYVDSARAASILNVIKSDNDRKSPIKIDVTNTPKLGGGDVSVKVTSSIALGASYKLFVAVVSYYSPMPNLPGTLTGSNGETEFYDAMNKMLPSSGGTTLNIVANTDQTFNFSYVNAGGLTWPAGQQYIVAFVQNTGTKEIVNVGTNLKLREAIASVAGNPYEYIPRSGQKTKSINISNTSDEDLLCTFSIANADNLAQVGWVAALNKTEATIPAQGNAIIQVTSTAVNRALFAPIILQVDPITTNGIPRRSTFTFGYLTEDTRVAVYYGSTTGAIGVILPALETTFGTESAYLPYNTDVLTAFPPSDFDAGLFPVGEDGRFNIVAFIPTINAMTAAGKGVWMSAPLGAAVATNPANQGNPGYPEANAWFTQKLGVGVKNIAVRNDGVKYTSFQVKGVAGDPIGDKFTSTVNQPVGSWPFAMGSQELLTINPGSKSKSWVFADNTSSNISGIRWEEPGKGRIVYTTFGSEHLPSPDSRKLMLQRILDWLLEPVTIDLPKITLSVQSINFGNVEVGNFKDLSFIIQNSGTADLELTSLELYGTDAVDFDFTSGKPGIDPVIVSPSGTHTVGLRFSPSVEKALYSARVVITANASSPDVELRGSGVTSVETEAASESGAIAIRLVGANPITESSNVEIRSLDAVSVSVIDLLGRNVRSLYNGSVSGSTTVPIPGHELSAGTYMIVASAGSERAVLTFVIAK